MTRPYHSPSSLALGARCEHAWALRYIAGISEPSTLAQQFGVALHAHAEGYFSNGERGALAWDSEPGRVFLGGAHLLPTPQECARIEIEHAIGDEPIAYPEGAPPREGAPTRGKRVHGVLFAGFRDLVVDPSEAARKRLGLESRGPILFDYKSSADAQRYALTIADLGADVQRLLYGLDVCDTWGRSLSAARWVYFDKRVHHRSRATDSAVSRDECLDRLLPAAQLARKLDEIPDVASAQKNPSACADYGGCKFHVSHGGPCDAKRRLGALIQRPNQPPPPKERDTPMNETPLQAKLRARQEALAASASAPAAEAAPTPAPAPAARKPRTPAAPAPVVEAPPAPAVDPLEAAKAIAERAERIAELSASVTLQRVNVAEAKAAYEAAGETLTSYETELAALLAEVRGAL